MKNRIILVIACLFSKQIFSNNIVVSNVLTSSRNVVAGVNHVNNFNMIQFNLSWENSWRLGSGVANWDAAWVFVKFRLGATDLTFTGVTSVGTTITVNNTSNLRVGMPIRVIGGTGAFVSNTIISSIINSTQFTVNTAPSVALSSANIECTRIWEHARLNNDGHISPLGAVIQPGLVNPGSTFDPSSNFATGVFIYRNSIGAGNISLSNVQLRWNYGANGVKDNDVISLQVFAIEMVYVPGGLDFNVGGGGGVSALTSTTINTSNATTAPTGTGSLGGQSGGYPTGQTAPISSTWPNGYNGFYCMKYEVSQGQYRDFLNTLTRVQQGNRITMDGNVGRYSGGNTWSGSAWSSSELNNLTTAHNRNGLRLVVDQGGNNPRIFACDLVSSLSLPSGVNQVDDGECIAMSNLHWPDGCAFSDWAGLRPMSELEFEKACRGNQAPVSGEFAWGNTSSTGATSIVNIGTSNEQLNVSGANVCFNNAPYVQGPVRVGAFATAASTRVSSGSSYYGIMELSGNLWERVVTIGNIEGRSFLGNHGDGSLSINGNATTNSWPGLTSGEVTVATGSGLKGGGWIYGTSDLRVSDRSLIFFTVIARNCSNGYRAVRSAN